MTRNTSIFLWIVGALIVIAIFGYTFYQSYQANKAADAQLNSVLGSATTTPTPSKDELAVRAAVINFGSQLQKVSLLTDTATIAAAMDATYARHVDAALLAQWKANPVSAPGRTTSSPWPDRIEITAVQKNTDNAYSVAGEIVEMTSAGESGRKSVVLTVAYINGSWLITRYEQFSDKG